MVEQSSKVLATGSRKNDLHSSCKNDAETWAPAMAAGYGSREEDSCSSDDRLEKKKQQQRQTQQLKNGGKKRW